MSGEPVTAQDGDLHETVEISGGLSQWLFDEFCGEWPTIAAGEDKYRPAYAEMVDADPDAIIIYRERDGAMFHVDIEVHVQPFQPEAVEP